MVTVIGVIMLSACQNPNPSIGAGNPYPVTIYTCQDGTRLAVRLMGDRASVAVNGGAAEDLPALGNEGTTFTNGRRTLTIVQGNVSWAVGRAASTPCSGS
jgi:hypothetical protein